MANQKQYWQFEIFGSDPDVIGFFGDAGIIIPSGSTAARPSAPTEGHMRYNTDLNVFEGYSGAWASFASAVTPTFDLLADTPVSKAGSANRVMIVNSAETDIEYSSALLLENSGRLRVPASYETLIDADTVITNRKYVNDQDNLQLSLSGGLMTGGITMGSNAILGLPTTPTSANEAASKAYVDQIASGIDYKESSHMATVANLPATYNNGTVGFGATLTATTPGVLPPSITDDHAHYFVGTRVLVQSQTDPIENGIYDITDIGSGEEVSEITTLPDVANSLDGTYFTFNDGATAFYVWFDTPAGSGDPAPGGTGIQVSIATGAAVAAVTSATIAAINASAALAVAYADEDNTFYIVNDNTGTATNSGAGTSGFTVTTTVDGTGSPTAWILTRSSDADNSPSNEVSGGMFTLIEDGAIYAGKGFILIEPTGDAVLGTDDLVFTIISGAGSFLPLAGGTMTGTISMGAAGIQIIGDTSSATAPAYSFASDLGTGLHQTAGASTMSMVIGTTATWNYSATAITPAVNVTQDIGSSGLKMRNVYADHFLPNFGAVGDPSYAFEGDATTGMYNDGAGGIGFAVGGNGALSVESDGTVSVVTASYETLVLADNDIPNKKYVDDALPVVPSSYIEIIDTDGDTSVNVEAAADDDTIRFNTGASPVGFPAATNTMTLASSGLSVALPTANVATTVGAPISLTAGAGNTTGAGGAVGVVGGDGGASGVGGAVAITAGAGNTTGAGGAVGVVGGAGGNAAGGGAVNITGGTTAAEALSGGTVNITGGTSTYTGDAYGGTVNIIGGAGTSYGGSVAITGGAATDAGGECYGVEIQGGSGGAFAGPIRIEGGDGTAGRSAGDVYIGGGQSGAGGTNVGGKVTIQGGGGYGTYKGGDVAIGSGSNPAGGTGEGGDILVTTGRGRDVNRAGDFVFTGGISSTGAGGSFHVTGGSSATGSSGAVSLTGGLVTGVSADGGDITLTGGNGGSTSGDAGDIILTPGATVGAGSAGAINITQTTAPTVTTDKLYNVGGALTWNGTDLTASGISKFAQDNTTTAAAEVFNHALGNTDVIVQVYDLTVSPKELIVADVEVTDANNVTVTLSVAPSAAGEYRVVVIA